MLKMAELYKQMSLLLENIKAASMDDVSELPQMALVFTRLVWAHCTGRSVALECRLWVLTQPDVFINLEVGPVPDICAQQLHEVLEAVQTIQSSFGPGENDENYNGFQKYLSSKFKGSDTEEMFMDMQAENSEFDSVNIKTEDNWAYPRNQQHMETTKDVKVIEVCQDSDEPKRIILKDYGHCRVVSDSGQMGTAEPNHSETVCTNSEIDDNLRTESSVIVEDTPDSNVSSDQRWANASLAGLTLVQRWPNDGSKVLLSGTLVGEMNSMGCDEKSKSAETIDGINATCTSRVLDHDENMSTTNNKNPVAMDTSDSPSGKVMYDCLYCGQAQLPHLQFLSWRQLKMHIAEKHCQNEKQEQSLHCPMCSVVLRTRSGQMNTLVYRISKHLYESHDKDIAGYTQCNGSFSVHKSPHTKIGTNHDSQMIEYLRNFFDHCLFCNSVVPVADIYIERAMKTVSLHWDIKHKKELAQVYKPNMSVPHTCPVCDFQVKTCGRQVKEILSNLMQHIGRVHQKWVKSKPTVEVKTECTRDKDKADPVVERTATYTCVYCENNSEGENTYESWEYLREHIKTSHVICTDFDEHLRCPYCSTSYKTFSGDVVKVIYSMSRHLAKKHGKVIGGYAMVKKELLPDRNQEESEDSSDEDHCNVDQPQEAVPGRAKQIIELSNPLAEQLLMPEDWDLDDGGWNCTLCLQDFSHRSALETHLLELHTPMKQASGLLAMQCGQCEWECRAKRAGLIARCFVQHCTYTHGLICKDLINSTQTESGHHMDDQDTSKVITRSCFLCDDNTMYELDTFVDHLHSVHIISVNPEERALVCSECQFQLTRDRTVMEAPGPPPVIQETMIAHMVKKHGRAVPGYAQIHRCSICSWETLINWNLCVHMFLAHNKINLLEGQWSDGTLQKPCPACGKIISRTSWIKHRYSCPAIHRKCDTLRYSCEQCPRAFCYRYQLESHVKSVHQRNCFSCSSCGMNCSSKRLLVKHCWFQHKLNLTKKEPIKCDTCEEMVPPGLMRIHKLIHTKHKCMTCDKLLSTKAKLAKHKATHEEGKGKGAGGLACALCGICLPSVRSANDLKRHMAAAHNIDRFQCNLCNYMATNQVNLERHMTTSHSDGPVLLNYCTICERQFSNKSNYQNHMYVRHGVNLSDRPPLVCHVCGFQTLGHSLMSAHVKNHNQATFPCSACSMTFKTEAIAKSHYRRAHEERRLMCPHCSKMFPTVNNLEKHIARIHTKAFFHCQQCDYKTWHQHRLKKHQLELHGIGRQEERIVLSALMERKKEELKLGKAMEVTIQMPADMTPHLAEGPRIVRHKSRIGKNKPAKNSRHENRTIQPVTHFPNQSPTATLTVTCEDEAQAFREVQANDNVILGCEQTSPEMQAGLSKGPSCWALSSRESVTSSDINTMNEDAPGVNTQVVEDGEVELQFVYEDAKEVITGDPTAPETYSVIAETDEYLYMSVCHNK